MINRVTHQMTARTAAQNLQASLAQLNKLTEQATSNTRISRPSDDPSGTAESLRLRGEQRVAQQHARNAQDGHAWLTTVDSAIQAGIDLIGRAQDLTIQGANGATAPAAREALAMEIDGIREALLVQANATYGGRSVFAGTSDEATAFDPDGTYTGVPGATVQRRIGPGDSVRVDADGAAVFGSGPGSVFALMSDIAADLRSGADVGARIDEIDGRRQQMLTELTGVGTRYNRLEVAEVATQERMGGLERRLSDVEDVDMARMIIDLKSAEVAYQGALGVTARVLQNSLLDFLR
ncbi:flagellar hook-associated protein FlgL [Occultella gossypii]|uniref:Flagellar hook-associated protein FlgL n=1 Tax=Occultella gossypii TaxID=2800820 RepID=A0ABS7S909_9MICO|nr:flagellar hook-associated protein FlgL [Occultella gossypii]MBZ2196844.1 flagellar hook-associated protein FlgL [Occultella gossypii]